MTGRTPACEDAGIAERMRQIQRDRMAAIAGCSCPPDTGTATGGELAHLPGCPLRQAQPSQMPAAWEAIQRARARVYRRAARGTPPLTADEIIERAIRAKAARHRVFDATTEADIARHMLEDDSPEWTDEMFASAEIRIGDRVIRPGTPPLPLPARPSRPGSELDAAIDRAIATTDRAIAAAKRMTVEIERACDERAARHRVLS